MEKRHMISRKKALKFLTAGTLSTLFVPSLLKSANSAGIQESVYQDYQDIFYEVYPFKLADLPYPHEALEPAIDARTMEIHHSRHHQGYVNNLNNALGSHSDLQSMTLAELNRHLHDLPAEVRSAVRNHGGGHLNHAIFWNTMSPSGGEPTGDLYRAIQSAFGSLDEMKVQFSRAAGTVFGSGWAWVVSDNEGKLSIAQTPNQDNPLTDGYTPLFGIDVWEHAYYLNYQNRRGDYIAAYLDLIHWGKVAEIYGESLG